MKVLLDINVVLDLLLEREPFVSYAKEIFVLIENGDVEGYLCANSVTTLHYLIGKSKNKQEADEIIAALLLLFDVAPVDKHILLEATHTNGIDYEDSVIYTSALYHGIDKIVTRDKKGFRHAQVGTVTPQAFLAYWFTKSPIS